ncbi:MAG: transglycosylase SLT domain-containing protein [Myxococcales bacterium]|nr:transglycosylase SLT domain-containing protein [Myxococcales bacterium]
MQNRGLLLASAFVLAGCTASTTDLELVAPFASDAIPIGDAIELAAATTDPDVASVRFEIDGQPIATCDPALPDEDCKRDDVWRWTTVFASPGERELVAIALDASGEELDRTTQQLRVVLSLPDDALAREDLVDGVSPNQLEAAGRGLLDPDRALHNIFGGISWRVANQRVRLANGTAPTGSVASVRTCMNRYGASIRKWADHYQISRASVAATALTESNCTNPAGSSDGLSSGPMQVTASTCSALMGLSRATCRSRMHTSPDFSFQVGAKYMGSSYQRNQHHRDPPKIAAAYNAGSLRRSSANRWHMVSTGNHIDRFVNWYNAYRSWE